MKFYYQKFFAGLDYYYRKLISFMQKKKNPEEQKKNKYMQNEIQIYHN